MALRRGKVRLFGAGACALLVSGAVACGACSSSSSSGAASPGGAGDDASAGDGSAAGDSSGAADAAALPDLTADLEPIRAKHHLPALTAAAFVDGKVVAHTEVGVRKQGDPTKVTTSDEWHLGSDTKAMTATLVGILVDEGKLSWTDTLGALFSGQTVDPGYASATIEMVLQHRAGFDHDVPDADWSQMVSDALAGKPPSPTRRAAVLDTLKQPPPKTVGAYSYSNAGYMTAGVVLEQKTGKDWETLVRERLFAPLGMTSCGFGAPATPPDHVDQPWAHLPVDGGAPTPVPPGVQSDNPPALGPAGSVHCSLEDWGKFLSMHVAGDRGATTLVTPATMKRLHTPPPGGDYAAGWAVLTRDWAGGTTLTHAGSNTMFFAITWLAPAKNLVVLATTNVGGDEAAAATDEALGPLIKRFAP